MEDPFGPALFGRSKSSSEPKVSVEKVRRLFDNHPQLVVEDMRSDYTGILMRVKHTDAPSIREAHRDPGPDKGRFLWSIFFCLVGACVGMAWPPAGHDAELETPLTIEPLGLTHSDMHQGNIMFGRLYPEEAEHSRVSIMRLIDFGEAQVRRPDASDLLVDELFKNEYDIPLDLARYRPASGSRNQATDKNLMDIGCVMAQVLAGRELAFVGACRGFIWDPDIHPSLDPDLRLLIKRCLAVDPLNRPRFEELTT
ncbi:hypothetical protein DL764_003779 [Monosporascus ibericus]|uniref:Protein kinase domain-containing protein n=1 Tax=Monosporascus ibericus TaxID=155417 RepID=A0A4V1XBA0_9PEZI|nr:hypothetical protein DL764_003779 [Monosporascus ibericus]